MAWTPAASRARRFPSPESSPNYSNIHSWVPSGLVTKPSRDMTILRTTFRSRMSVETYQSAQIHRRSDSMSFGNRRQRLAGKELARLLRENDVLAGLADSERVSRGFASL